MDIDATHDDHTQAPAVQNAVQDDAMMEYDEPIALDVGLDADADMDADEGEDGVDADAMDGADEADGADVPMDDGEVIAEEEYEEGEGEEEEEDGEMMPEPVEIQPEGAQFAAGPAQSEVIAAADANAGAVAGAGASAVISIDEDAQAVGVSATPTAEGGEADAAAAHPFTSAGEISLLPHAPSVQSLGAAPPVHVAADGRPSDDTRIDASVPNTDNHLAVDYNDKTPAPAISQAVDANASGPAAAAADEYANAVVPVSHLDETQPTTLPGGGAVAGADDTVPDEAAEEDYDPDYDESADADNMLLTVHTLPPVLIHPPTGPAKLLFGVPADEEVYTDIIEADLDILLDGEAQKYGGATLDVLLGALRRLLDVQDQGKDKEMVLEERGLGLKLGEHDVHLGKVTLLELLQVHHSCDLPTPVQLYVTFESGRFIHRFEAIRKELVAQAERREGEPLPEGDVEEDEGYESEVEGEGVEGEAEGEGEAEAEAEAEEDNQGDEGTGAGAGGEGGEAAGVGEAEDGVQEARYTRQQETCAEYGGSDGENHPHATWARGLPTEPQAYPAGRTANLPLHLHHDDTPEDKKGEQGDDGPAEQAQIPLPPHPATVPQSADVDAATATATATAALATAPEPDMHYIPEDAVAMKRHAEGRRDVVDDSNDAIERANAKGDATFEDEGVDLTYDEADVAEDDNGGYDENENEGEGDGDGDQDGDQDDARYVDETPLDTAALNDKIDRIDAAADEALSSGVTDVAVPATTAVSPAISVQPGSTAVPLTDVEVPASSMPATSNDTDADTATAAIATPLVTATPGVSTPAVASPLYHSHLPEDAEAEADAEGDGEGEGYFDGDDAGEAGAEDREEEEQEGDEYEEYEDDGADEAADDEDDDETTREEPLHMAHKDGLVSAAVIEQVARDPVGEGYLDEKDEDDARKDLNPYDDDDGEGVADVVTVRSKRSVDDEEDDDTVSKRARNYVA